VRKEKKEDDCIHREREKGMTDTTYEVFTGGGEGEKKI